MTYRRLICLLLILVVPGTALSETICWIDRVTAESLGVRVFFHMDPAIYVISGAVVAQKSGVPPRRFTIKEGRVNWQNGDSEAGLLLKPGESAPLMMAVENSCRISFAQVQGHRGIRAVASFTVPGADPSDFEKFIWAD